MLSVKVNAVRPGALIMILISIIQQFITAGVDNFVLKILHVLSVLYFSLSRNATSVENKCVQLMLRKGRLIRTLVYIDVEYASAVVLWRFHACRHTVRLTRLMLSD